MNTDLMFSNESNEWATPKYIYDYLDNIFHFTLDVCASEINHKHENYFSIKDDGLSQSWANNICFMNPPYGREIGKWIQKAHEESKNADVICLIPAITDTKYWHDHCRYADEIWLLKGRIKFELPNGADNSAPFPSAIIIFREHGYHDHLIVRHIEIKKEK